MVLNVVLTHLVTNCNGDDILLQPCEGEMSDKRGGLSESVGVSAVRKYFCFGLGLTSTEIFVPGGHKSLSSTETVV